MKILNLISLALWFFIAFHSFLTFRNVRKDEGMSRREITAVTILLLCGLNITQGVINFFVPAIGHMLSEYFYIGTSIFQLLLCNIVLKYIDSNPPTKTTSKD